MKRHALFIGVDRYEDEQLRSLDCAESDAHELHGFFKHRAGFDAAECLLAPSSEQVLQAVERLTARLSPGDLFLFFFAGHGVTHEGQHLLLCAKARHSRLRHKQEVVPVDLLKEETAKAGVHRVFVLDACRTDLLKTRQAGVGGFSGANALRDVVAGPAANASDGSLTLVCSCDEGGQAGEITSLRGGVFRLALQETLAAAAREERELAVGEGLVSEVERVMTRLAAAHGIAARQRPWFQRSGGAPLLLMVRKAIKETAPACRLAPPDPLSAVGGLMVQMRAEAELRKVAAERAFAEAEQMEAEQQSRHEARQQHFERLYSEYLALREDQYVTREERLLAWTELCAELGVEDAPNEPSDLEWTEAGAQIMRTIRPWANSLGMNFVPVPGTEVLFCVWVTRVRDYESFAKATGREWPKPNFTNGPDHPVVHVSWEDAQAFCKWLTTKERRERKLSESHHYRLPADWEWSVAVGLNESREGTPKNKSGKINGVYPWGNQWPPPRGAGNYAPSLRVDDYEHMSPVGSFAANPYGLYDLAACRT